MEQQAPVAQEYALPADIQSILEDPAPQATPSPEQPAPVAQPVPVPAAPAVAVPPTPAEQHVPLHVLLEERKERQAYQRQLQQFVEAQRQASQPQPQPIDPITNPEEAFRALEQRIAAQDQKTQNQALHNRANTSEMLARKEYGRQAVEAAREAALQAGLGNHFLNQPEPYEALMDWDRGQKAAKEIGDPTTYKERLKAEILAELKGAAVAPVARPGVPQTLPPSLSTATRASGNAPIVQDTGDFFKSMFAKPNRSA